ncbi:MAG: HAD family phosphatase [Verrucomicrobiota bacterium]
MSIQIPAGNFKGLIFDFDGTLVDSMGVHQKAWQNSIESFGGKFPLTMEEYFNLGGTSTLDVAKLFLEKNNLTHPPQDLVLRKESLFSEMVHLIRPIDCVLQYALTQKEQGVQISIASGCSYDLILAVLQHLSLALHFPLILTPRDVKRSKPAPDLFLLAAQKMNLAPSECLVFEDSPLGIQAAEAAGMAWVHVPKTLWKY